MKKLLVVIMSVVMIFGVFAISACNKKGETTSSQSSASSAKVSSSDTSVTTSASEQFGGSMTDTANNSLIDSSNESTSVEEYDSSLDSATDSADHSTDVSENENTSASGNDQTSVSDNEQASVSDEDQTSAEPESAYDFTVTFVSGTEDIYTITETDGEYTLTFGTISEKTVYAIKGTLSGNIIVDVGDENKFELEMNGFTVKSEKSAPICALSGDEFTLTAKKGYTNFVYDNRETVDDEDETQVSSAIYSAVDTSIGGKGELIVVSENNNGIHSKDDLEVKNLTLIVSCLDNALKGNDSVTIESGAIVLIARRGDGIKTSNSKISDKGNQKGTVTINGGTVNIYSACDGIDAAYNVEIANDPIINIYTDKYSEYSEEVTAVSDSFYYIRTTSSAYSYSVKYYNTETEATLFKNAAFDSTVTVNQVGGRPGQGGKTTYYYYKLDKPVGYDSMIVYAYASAAAQGTEDSAATSRSMTLNSNYDTIVLSFSGTSINVNWTNRATQSQPGGMGGEGNSDKGDYSTKGIKADNEIVISGGTISVKAYDDAIHANSDNTLENEETPLGYVTITGGTLTLYSNDDGIHADGKISISGGEIHVTNAYEGMEGNVIEISGGKTYVFGSDDGINAPNGTASTTPLIKVTGGYLDVTVSPSGDTDGIDSNGNYEQTGGIVITRGPNSQMAAALDFGDDRSNYARISGGTIIILGYGNITSSGSASSVSGLSLHSKGNHTVTINGVSYTFNNSYSYGRTIVYSDTTVS